MVKGISLLMLRQNFFDTKVGGEYYKKNNAKAESFKMFKTLLIIPPDYECTFPPLGTAALSAFLKQKGISCEQRDLNLKYRDFLLRRIHGPSIQAGEKKVLLDTVLKIFFLEKLKDRYYSPFLPEQWRCLSVSALRQQHQQLLLFYRTAPVSPHLWRYMEDRLENTFYQFLEEEKILDLLDKEKIDLVRALHHLAFPGDF